MSRVSRPPSEIEICCWPGCRAEVYYHPAPPPFCGMHLIRCAVFVSETMGHFLLDSKPPLEKPTRTYDPVVYYVRLGDRVKIGTTVDLTSRLNSFRTVYMADDIELLATEPGDGLLERERHREFAAERLDARHELFNPSPRLLAHIESVKAA